MSPEAHEGHEGLRNLLTYQFLNFVLFATFVVKAVAQCRYFLGLIRYSRSSILDLRFGCG